VPTTPQADGGVQSAAEEAAPDSQAAQDARLDRIEKAVDKLSALVEGILPGSHAEAQERTERNLDRPSSIEEQVQAELAKRDREAKDKTRDEEHTSMREQLAKLREVPPAPPVPRRTRMLGWGPG